MPLIKVNMLQGRSVETKRKYASEMTRITCECLNVEPESVRIIFSEMPPENLVVAGTLVADKKTTHPQ
jgi:4-oxalocrotonate tautomerase